MNFNKKCQLKQERHFLSLKLRTINFKRGIPLSLSNKKGIIGEVFGAIPAIIALFIILGLFVMGSGLVKLFANIEEGVQIDKKFDKDYDKNYFNSFKEQIALKQEILKLTPDEKLTKLEGYNHEQKG